jgi:hypothetical protein
VVVGVPGQIVRQKPHADSTGADLDHNVLPDVITARINLLLARIEHLERVLAETHGSEGGDGHQHAEDVAEMLAGLQGGQPDQFQI